MAKKRTIPVLTNANLITCIVQRGYAEKVVQAAFDAGAYGATIHYARGIGVREKLGVLGVAVEAEKEVIKIVVSSEQTNRVFDSMFLSGELDAPGRGFIFVTHLEKAATYISQSILNRLGVQDGGSQ
jgi:nitrogen regulatory protein P-II 1